MRELISMMQLYFQSALGPCYQEICLENRWDWRPPYGKGFWTSLNIGSRRIPIDEVAIGIMLL